MTYPEGTCVVLACDRRVARSASGAAVYNRCDEHLRALLSGAFGPDTHERPGAEPTGVAPNRIAGDPGVTVADAVAVSAAASRVDQPDGDLAGARRAIASATPGRSTPDWAETELTMAHGYG